MEEDTSLVWRNAFYLDSLNSNDFPRHLISMEEIHISMRKIQISMQEIRNPANSQYYLLLTWFTFNKFSN